MYNVITRLAVTALILGSCNKDKESAQNKLDEAQLEVYKRGTEPVRTEVTKEPPSWLGTQSVPACPAGALPKTFSEPYFDPQLCAGDRLDGCLEKCKNSDANACYAAAILLQESNDAGAADISTPLYARACQLGDASGCTNWAASMDMNLDSNQECLFRTFEASCERGQDPWGCTMYARILALRYEPDESLGKIRSLIPIACKWGEPAPACQALRAQISRLEAGDIPHQDAAPQ